MTNENLAVEKSEAKIAVLAPEIRELSISEVFEAAKRVSPENLAVMKELLAMDAERKFTAAFVALQGDIPVFTAKTEIKNRGKYEKFEDLMHVLSPLLTRHGFTICFDSELGDGRVTETCILSHAGGFSRRHKFSARVGAGDTPTQADCKTATTAKRNSLIRALNLVIRQDCLTEENDASLEGEFITPAQVEELDRRVIATKSNRAAFLKFAGAETFSEIKSGKYAVLDGFLKRKEATQ